MVVDCDTTNGRDIAVVSDGHCLVGSAFIPLVIGVIYEFVFRRGRPGKQVGRGLDDYHLHGWSDVCPFLFHILFCAKFLTIVNIDALLRTTGEAATAEVVVVLGAVVVDGSHYGMADACRVVVVEACNQCSCS